MHKDTCPRAGGLCSCESHVKTAFLSAGTPSHLSDQGGTFSFEASKTKPSFPFEKWKQAVKRLCSTTHLKIGCKHQFQWLFRNRRAQSD